MENLNAEQIKFALVCHADWNGMCEQCPYTISKACGSQLARDALALIKKLTEENERLRAEGAIRLPIKVGQWVYVPWRWKDQQAVAMVKVEEITFYDSQMHYMFLIDMKSDDEPFNQSFGSWKTDESIGNTVFLTEEEAEKALKGENENGKS